LTTADVVLSLAVYIAVYAVIYAFGLYYIYRLLRDGLRDASASPGGATPGRPLAGAIDATGDGPMTHIEPSMLIRMLDKCLGVCYRVKHGYNLPNEPSSVSTHLP
jgi:hypothetical protein